MRIEAGGRSDVPHFARRLCLPVRQTCEKIAVAVTALIPRPPLTPLSLRATILRPILSRTSVSPRRAIPCTRLTKRIMIFLKCIKGRSFSMPAYVIIRVADMCNIIMQRMTQRDRPAPASLKVTVSFFFVNGAPSTT